MQGRKKTESELNWKLKRNLQEINFLMLFAWNTSINLICIKCGSLFIQGVTCGGDVPGTHRDLCVNVERSGYLWQPVSLHQCSVLLSGPGMTGSQLSVQAGCSVRYPFSKQDRLLFAWSECPWIDKMENNKIKTNGLIIDRKKCATQHGTLKPESFIYIWIRIFHHIQMHIWISNKKWQP